MKNLKFLALSAFLFMGSLTLSAQSFGVIDVEDVLNAYPAKQNADAELNSMVERHQNEIKKRQSALLAIEEDFQKKIEGKSENEIMGMQAEFEAAQQDYMTKQQELSAYQQAAANEIAEKEETLLKPIEDAVKASIAKVAAGKGLQYVMEKSLLLYSNGVDITADVKSDLGIN